MNSKSVAITVFVFVFMFSLLYNVLQNNMITISSYTKRKLHNDSNIALILDEAMKIKERPVLITIVNDGYNDMVYSWLCNTKHMGFHKQVLLIVTGKTGTAKMKELSSDVNIVVIDVDQSMKGHQSYSHVGYLKIMVLRTSIQLALLRNDIEVYFFECDSVFLKNPLPILRSYSGKCDIVFISNYKFKSINGGFLYLFPTLATKEVFKELNRMMQVLYEKINNKNSNELIASEGNDQTFLSKLHDENYYGLKSIVIPFGIFSDGKWYNISVEERKQTNPVLIHNNWIIGNQAKMARAKKWGHWFLTEKRSCDLTKIKRLFPGK